MTATIAPSVLNTLRKAVGLLTTDAAALKADILRQCDRISQPTLRITVFGPFNYGKSTLLNALLGEVALPIDLIPTTGTAITITYGPALTSCVRFNDGKCLKAPGTELLQRYARLNKQQQQNVTAVEVQCPHPFLQSGVELVDLPGTDDQTTHNELVYTHLTDTDVVIQLLDGRKLMTLTEREQLQHWLIDRGITTVVFVVNFLNLMPPEDRHQVMHRLRTLAQDFRTTLPRGVSNLYAVDALPALRARLKGDLAAATQTGLPTLETALHTLVQTRQPHRLPRLQLLAGQLQQTLALQHHSLQTAAQPDLRRTAIQQRALELIQTGFERSVTDLQTWLQLENLLTQYQYSFATALDEDTALEWLGENLQPVWQQKKQAIEEWVYRACDFFEQPRPVDLWISWPLPETPEQQAADAAPRSTTQDVTPVAIATGVGWILAGPVGAVVLGGASHFLNQSDRQQTDPPAPLSVTQAAAHSYLSNFSTTALTTLSTYQTKTKSLLYRSVDSCANQPQRAAQLTLLQNTLIELNESVEMLAAYCTAESGGAS